MDILQALVLGFAQGASEFLPISSSAHLVLIPAVMGWEAPGLAFDVMLHAATLMAVLAYFREDVARMAIALFTRGPDRASDRRLAWLVILGTIPAGLLGLVFGDFVEGLFERVAWVGVFLLITSALLATAETLGRQRLHLASEMTWRQALLVGAAQAAAMAPGISRSGATIAAGLGAGLDREKAARFSFLLSIPIILAATGVSFMDVYTGTVDFPSTGVAIAGFVTAGVTGYLAIAGLLAYLRSRSLYVFSIYTAALGVAVLLWRYLA